jgi:integrase
MAGKNRHLKEKDGRFYTRISVPARLRPFMENPKSELVEALGADRRAAVRKHAIVVARFQSEILALERMAGAATAKPLVEKVVPLRGRFSMTPEAIAATHYAQQVARDEHFRNFQGYASIGIDDGYVKQVRDGMSGLLDNAALNDIVQPLLASLQVQGNVDFEVGSQEWRKMARMLCAAEYEALERMVERDEGNFSGAPTRAFLAGSYAQERTEDTVSLTALWEDYVASRIVAGFMKDRGRRQRPVIENLRNYLKHDNANQVTKKDLIDWKGYLLDFCKLSAKTVNDIYLSAIRSLFLWAFENERLTSNVAGTVRQAKPRTVLNRERGFTDDEALNVLRASRQHTPKANQHGYVKETKHMTAAKRWAPILCAFTGARISEVTQLRKEDVREVNGRWIIRITPEAGTVKAGGFRDVPLHRQIVALGFLEFVDASSEGPLFHGATDHAQYATASASVSDELAKWLRRANIVPKGLQPNHAWRHRFKTKSRDLGLSPQVVEAIQGHASGTAGDRYGATTIAAMLNVIDAFPDFDLSG